MFVKEIQSRLMIVMMMYVIEIGIVKSETQHKFLLWIQPIVDP